MPAEIMEGLRVLPPQLLAALQVGAIDIAAHTQHHPTPLAPPPAHGWERERERERERGAAKSKASSRWYLRAQAVERVDVESEKRGRSGGARLGRQLRQLKQTYIADILATLAQVKTTSQHPLAQSGTGGQ
jgi:hypothetical protein